MSLKDIIEMAVQAGYDEHHAKFDTRFETFAKLVASAATVKKHQELYRLAEDAPVRGDARETRQNILHAIRARGDEA